MSLPFNRDALIVWSWDAGERAVKTGAQLLGASMLAGATFTDVNWDTIMPMVLYAMLLSLVTSVGSARVGEAGTASLVGTTPIGKHHIKDTTS